LVIRVNVITEDSLLERRLLAYARKIDKLDLQSSTTPLPEDETDAYVVPVRSVGALLDGTERPRTWLPVVAYGKPTALASAFLAGCSDYLREPWTAEELSCRLMRVVDTSFFDAAWGRVRLTSSSASSKHGEAELSIHEYRILRVLLLQLGRPVPREVLYYAIWGRTDGRSRTVDVHVSSLRRKLKAIAGPEATGSLIRSARGLGYFIPACGSRRTGTRILC